MQLEIQLPLGELQKKAVRTINGWDFTAVAKKTKQDLALQGIVVDDGYINRGIEALRRYHIIAVLDPNNGHAVSDTLDPFWHTQVLFTKDYFRFCDQTLGEYMHHFPLDHSDQPKLESVRKLYEYTGDIHRQIFGHDDEEFYPLVLNDDRLCCPHGCVIGPLTTEACFPQQTSLVPHFASFC